MTIEKDETREYVAAITDELATMSRKAGLPFLAYLLGLAQIEASGRASMTDQMRNRRASWSRSDRVTRRQAMDVGRSPDNSE